MKLKKKSGLMGAVIALSAASLVSVGFASWVISQGDSKPVSGSIIVDDVDSKVYRITTSWVTDYTGATAVTGEAAGKVVYGHPSSMAIDNAWLTNDDASMVEALVFYLRVDVTNAKGKTVAEVLKTPAQLTSPAGNYASISPTLVGALPTPTLDDGVTSFTAKSSAETETDGFVVYKIEFTWGSYFGATSTNPYVFYNTGKTASGFVNGTAAPTWGDDAVDKLTQIHDALDGATYSLTIETTNYTA